MMQVRITPTELILEFGTFFPEDEKQPIPGPKDFSPETRVVLNIAALDQIMDALQKAAAARKTASQPAQKAQ